MADNLHKGHRDRLRQRLLSGERLDESVVLELLLCYGIPQKDVRPLADELLRQLGSLDGVLSSDAETLCAHDGIKTSTAALIRLVDWIRQNVPCEKPGTIRCQDGRPEYQLSLISDAAIPDSEPESVSPLIVPSQVPRRRAPSGSAKLFANSLLAETIELLAKLPDSESIDELRAFLRDNLHFSSEQTRVRNANYITNRMFPDGHVDDALIRFARLFAGRQELRDVCFYRFGRAEPLMCQLMGDLIGPALGAGALPFASVREYLYQRFPDSNSLKHGTRAVVDALLDTGLAKEERRRLTFSFREVLLPSFAFVLHGEYPVPGMYNIEDMENNTALSCMLWEPYRLISALYELRNSGLISKVSEIDSIRQFTTRYTPEQLVDRLSEGT